MSYLFGAPRWGCPWHVPPASVLGCVRCGWLCVRTRSLTHPVSRTVRRSTGDSAGASGLFRVDADTAPFGWEDVTPGSRACVRVRALLGWLGRAGLRGAFLCASPSLVAALGGLLVCVCPHPGLSCPVCGCCWGFFFLVLRRPGSLRLSAFSGPGRLGPCSVPVLLPAHPEIFFLLFPLSFLALPVRVVPWFSSPWCCGPWRPVVLPPGPPVCFFCFFFVLFFPSPSPSPRPPRLFFLLGFPALVFLFVRCFFFVFFCLCAGSAVLWLVCVSCALGYAGVCCLCWAWFLPRAAAPCCRCLAPCRGPWLCSPLGCGAALLWSSVVRCGAVCVVSCWWCRVVWLAPAGAVCCCLWLPAVPCWVWLPAVVFRWCVLSRLLLPCRAACCPAVCCGLLWCPAPLCCILCSVVLCRRVVPCCAALLPVLLCWWRWFVSLPCVSGAALRCVLSGASLVRAVVGASRFALCGLVVPLWCVVDSRAAVVRWVLCFAAGVPFSFKNAFLIFENKNQIKKRNFYSTQRTLAGRQPVRVTYM